MAYRRLNITLGLVNVPVTIDPLCSATRPSASLTCPDDGAKLKTRRVCPECGVDHTDDAARLYDGVSIEDPEAPEALSGIELESFVEGVELSSVERTYSVDAQRGHESGLSILHAALVSTGTVAIGQVVLDKAARQVALEATPAGIRLHFLRYADSFRTSDARLVDADPALVELAVRLIDAKRAERVELIPDSYAAALHAAINGTTPAEKPKPSMVEGDALLVELRASVAATKKKPKPKAKPRRGKVRA